MAKHPKITLHGPGATIHPNAINRINAPPQFVQASHDAHVSAVSKANAKYGTKLGVVPRTPAGFEKVALNKLAPKIGESRAAHAARVEKLMKAAGSQDAELAQAKSLRRQAQGLKPHQKQVMKKHEQAGRDQLATERNIARQRDAAKVARDKASQTSDPVQRARLIKDANSLNAEANRMEKQAAQLKSSASPAAQIDQKMAVANTAKSADGFSEAKGLTGKTEKFVTGGKGGTRAVVTPNEDGTFSASSDVSVPGAVMHEGHGKFNTLEEAKAAAKQGLAARIAPATAAKSAIAEKMSDVKVESPDAFDYKGERFHEKMFTPAQVEETLTASGVPAHRALAIRRHMERMSGENKKWSPQQILDEYSGGVDPEKIKRALSRAKHKADVEGSGGHWDDQPRVPAGDPDGGQWTKG